MADYQRVRDWVDKNINPRRFKTLEAFIDKLEKAPGVGDKTGLISDYKNANKDNFAFETRADLKQFKVDQKKALEEFDKAQNQEEELIALQKARDQLDNKIQTLTRQTAKVSPVAKPEPENIITGTVKKVGRFIKNLFGGN